MRTNIYGTIGPACRSVETLRRLFAEGMTGVRLNLSHTSLADAADWIANIHQAYESQSGGAGIDCAQILMDLQGPELRIGTLRESRQLSEGEKVILADMAGKGTAGAETIPVPGFILPHLARGQELLLDDGQLLLIGGGNASGERTRCRKLHRRARRMPAEQKEHCTSWGFVEGADTD